MTLSELNLLKASVDQVLVLETKAGACFAQVLFVFDEGETPDMFYLEMEPHPGRGLVQKGKEGHSLLLADIVAVSPFAG